MGCRGGGGSPMQPLIYEAALNSIRGRMENQIGGIMGVKKREKKKLVFIVSTEVRLDVFDCETSFTSCKLRTFCYEIQ
jgi:hypothetical protein